MRGKEIRLERIMNRNTKKTVIVPMDHGVTNGPIAGLIDMGQTVNLVADGGANAVIGHVGLALYGHRQGGRDIGLILHLSASTSLGPDPNEKVLVNSVTNALKMGADAVSMHVNIGAESEARMLQSRARGGGVHGVGDAAPRDDVPAGEEHKKGERCRAGEACRTGGSRARRRYRKNRVHRRPGVLPRSDERLPGTGSGRRRFKDG